MRPRNVYRGIAHLNVSAGYPRQPLVQTDLPSQQTPPVAPYSNKVQPDIVQFFDDRQLMRGPHAVRSIGDTWKGITDPKIPKVRFANRSQVILQANVPQIVIPQNINRSAFLICNTTGVLIYCSFGFPVQGTGIPIPVNAREGGAGYSAPIDDIYVTCSAAGAIVTAYEGAAAALSDEGAAQ